MCIFLEVYKNVLYYLGFSSLYLQLFTSFYKNYINKFRKNMRSKSDKENLTLWTMIEHLHALI